MNNKDTWQISLTRNEWHDLMETLRQYDKPLAENLVDQIDQQMKRTNK
jgi:hypothetical protein